MKLQTPDSEINLLKAKQVSANTYTLNDGTESFEIEMKGWGRQRTNDGN